MFRLLLYRYLRFEP